MRNYQKYYSAWNSFNPPLVPGLAWSQLYCWGWGTGNFISYFFTFYFISMFCNCRLRRYLNNQKAWILMLQIETNVYYINILWPAFYRAMFLQKKFFQNWFIILFICVKKNRFFFASVSSLFYLIRPQDILSSFIS